ncbi:S1/P1 nuclease [uncultured Paraglaciecola sp.]|uniref:S1/P1 nuclease n=1 Tax=uncultured Paraglaciecola sp. TaxID=1765024 RepID=UPI0030DCE537|tara:strand:- start:9657 stop:10427 length:771 start_codon:yes stop_codon:yes gene_type:complete
MQKVIFGLVVATFSVNVLAWGQIGHRITGAIAQQHLTPHAQAEVSALLPNEDLAEAATYPDEMRSNPEVFWQETAGPYHYVTIPEGKTYAQVGAPKEGDGVSALKMFTATLKDSKASKEEKQLALRFIVHIIGDLHQPLHAGNGTDRGGNDVKVNFFWKDSNLHRVWDSELLDQRQLSYTEWTARLNRKISLQDIDTWNVVDPQVWIAESVKIRDEIYPKEEKISWDYLYNHLPQAQLRLQMAGIRIATYLNDVLK